MDSCPLDVLLNILAHLPVSAVLVLRRTSRTLYAATHLRPIWARLFRTHVLERHIPCPPSPAVLCAPDLEALTRRALTLRRAWTSPQPVPRRHLTFGTPAEPTAHTIFLQFLPGRSNRWLISVRMTARPRTYLLQCWDVALDDPKCVAELRHADGPYRGVVLNSDPSSLAVLAMQSAQTETFSIRFDAQDPEYGFETVATMDGIRELHLLSGSTLITRHIDDGRPLSIWDLTDLPQEKIQLLNPSLIQPDDHVHAIHLAYDYALVVRVQSIEIYSTIPWPSPLYPHSTPIAYPLAQFKFQWRTDNVVLCAQHTPASSPSSSLPPPIHLLVRFGSIYPWPVNVLHHYCLLPNPAYRAGGRVHQPTPHAHARAVTTEYNLPYDPRPYSTHTIGSPVRLFGQSAMTLGKHGTALWLDNHTEDWLGPSERGQRLAGRLIRLDGDAGTNKDSDQAEAPTASAGSGYERACGAAAANAAYVTDTTMLFGVRDDDAWTRIAMEEETGRIVLGHVDGAITLLEY